MRRSSDSTKYGTNKSSGTSVTSGNHNHNHHHQSGSGHSKLNGVGGKHTSICGVHESVSNSKPPLHPSQTNRCPIAPAVHNNTISTSSNNRLYNNMVFHNNQYTFSLNRDGVGNESFASEARPSSASSLYSGDGRRKMSRGTKSDIGVPCRRNGGGSGTGTAAATSKRYSNYLQHQSQQQQQQQNLHTHQEMLRKNDTHLSDIPSVKSDFLLSYLNNSEAENYFSSSGLGSTSAYQLSTSTGIDYLENYRSTMYEDQPHRLYSTSSSSKLESLMHCGATSNVISGRTCGSNYLNRNAYESLHSSSKANRKTSDHLLKQRNRISAAHATAASIANANVGPLLYLEYVDRHMTASNDTSSASKMQPTVTTAASALTTTSVSRQLLSRHACGGATTHHHYHNM